MRRAASQSGEAAWALGVSTANDVLMETAARMGLVVAEAYMGQKLYLNLKSPNSSRAAAWQELSHAAYRGDSGAQSLVGILMWKAGDYDGAAKWLASAAVDGDPIHVDPYASFLATCRDQRYRDPGRALHLAIEDLRRTGLEGSQSSSVAKTAASRESIYSTLAAAYAANGEYAEAVALELKNLALVTGKHGETERAAIQARLSAYRAKMPWHDYPYPLVN
jgi:hypothetical protein